MELLWVIPAFFFGIAIGAEVIGVRKGRAYQESLQKETCKQCPRYQRDSADIKELVEEMKGNILFKQQADDIGDGRRKEERRIMTGRRGEKRNDN